MCLQARVADPTITNIGIVIDLNMVNFLPEGVGLQIKFQGPRGVDLSLIN
jgi:hypothetical protein